MKIKLELTTREAKLLNSLLQASKILADNNLMSDEYYFLGTKFQQKINEQMKNSQINEN